MLQIVRPCQAAERRTEVSTDGGASRTARAFSKVDIELLIRHLRGCMSPLSGFAVNPLTSPVAATLILPVQSRRRGSRTLRSR